MQEEGRKQQVEDGEEAGQGGEVEEHEESTTRRKT